MPQRPPRQRLSSNALVFTNIASPPEWSTLPANLCPLSRIPISRGSITHALYATFRFRAQAQSNSM
jgi:hypothetical protein